MTKESGEPPVCPMCKAPQCRSRYWFEDRTYLQCQSCSCRHLFVNPVPSGLEEQLEEGSHHLSKEKLGWDYSPEKWEVVYRPKIRNIERLLGGRGRMLDIGCGNGSFAAFAASRSWVVHAVEPRASSAAAARAHGVNVREGVLERMAFEGKDNDAIVMWQVIEHLRDPAVLGRAWGSLKRGGVVAISTPNTAGVGHALLKKRWPAIEPGVHYHLFTPASLDRFMLDAGFRLERRFSHDLELSTVQTLLGRGPGRGRRPRGGKNATAFAVSRFSRRGVVALLNVNRLLNLALRAAGAGENIYAFYRKGAYVGC